MGIGQLVALAIVGALLLTVIRQAHPGIALVVSIGLGVLLLTATLYQLKPIVTQLEALSSLGKVNNTLLIVVLKIIGIAYLVELGADICRDAGENALAARLELAGRILILAMGLPILTAVVASIAKLLQ
ncbi:MAG: stage III sporulation protein AD [Firmicutes bacterium]|nr:stage III sporulation protein AD [Bacillota bacterium]